jgi:hypothetical protein
MVVLGGGGKGWLGFARELRTIELSQTSIGDGRKASVSLDGASIGVGKDGGASADRGC